LVGQDAAFHVPQFHEPVTSDRYAGNWPTEAFRKVGVTVKPSDWTRSKIYLAALPMVMSNQVELLDLPRLLTQLRSLERRKRRQGKDTVDAPPRQHEDVANSAYGALVLAALEGRNVVRVRKAIWGFVTRVRGNPLSHPLLAFDTLLRGQTLGGGVRRTLGLLGSPRDPPAVPDNEWHPG
jgi:hypothetical protein